MASNVNAAGCVPTQSAYELAPQGGVDSFFEQLETLVSERKFKEAWNLFDQPDFQASYRVRAERIWTAACKYQVHDHIPEVYRVAAHQTWFADWTQRNPDFSNPLKSVLAQRHMHRAPARPRDQSGKLLKDENLIEMKIYRQELADTQRVRSNVSDPEVRRAVTRTNTIDGMKAMQEGAFAQTSGTTIAQSKEYLKHRRRASHGSRVSAEQLLSTEAHEVRHISNSIRRGLAFGWRLADIREALTYRQVMTTENRAELNRKVDYQGNVRRNNYSPSGEFRGGYLRSGGIRKIKLGKLQGQFEQTLKAFPHPSELDEKIIQLWKGLIELGPAIKGRTFVDSKKTDEIITILLEVPLSYSTEFDAYYDTGTNRVNLASAIWGSSDKTVESVITKLEKIEPGLSQELGLDEVHDGYSLAACVDFIMNKKPAELRQTIDDARARVATRASLS